jgi:hypothetical protein
MGDCDCGGWAASRFLSMRRRNRKFPVGVWYLWTGRFYMSQIPSGLFLATQHREKTLAIPVPPAKRFRICLRLKRLGYAARRSEYYHHMAESSRAPTQIECSLSPGQN